MQTNDRNAGNDTPTKILHPGSKQLFRYWESLRAERPCPDKCEFSLVSLKSVLQNMVIMERKPNSSWNYRLAGTAACDLLQKNLTGTDPFAGFDLFESDIIRRTFEIAYSRLQPILIGSRLVGTDNTVTPAEMIVMPVSDEASGKVLLYGGIFGFEVGERFGTLIRRELTSSKVIWTEHEFADQLLAKAHHRAPPQLRVIKGGKF